MPATQPEHADSGVLTKRQWSTIPHDQVKYIGETVRGGTEGNAIRRYEPFLHIAHGCQSYAAVSASGQVGGGLKPSGGPSSGCNAVGNGQTYARGIWHRGRYAIMYAWYFPKDQSTALGIGGHRHDWENVVIWIDNPANANPRVFGAAASGHGKYKKTTNPQMRDGGNLQVEYYTSTFKNHELQFKTSPGWNHDMVDYDAIKQQIRTIFDSYNWGKANCPFNKWNFIKNLDLAWI
ncbi:necrosis inducing protein [Elsinoe ampelina]|uniref:Necrosis inducing protein n=1 Tax=Elsinoe ampelina TaxID=302913 RepID=A0A6A6G7P1_9PEZI|nr:necrosis inducing protein [Elsinoe ampelina]